jgi:indolepyruvate ferredoxin oxidoreductase beta subunit
MLKNRGSLIYYDTVWQPLPVRLDQAPEVSTDDIRVACQKRGIAVTAVFQDDLPDIRMQNMVVLAAIRRQALIPKIDPSHYRQIGRASCRERVSTSV